MTKWVGRKVQDDYVHSGMRAREKRISWWCRSLEIRHNDDRCARNAWPFKQRGNLFRYRTAEDQLAVRTLRKTRSSYRSERARPQKRRPPSSFRSCDGRSERYTAMLRIVIISPRRCTGEGRGKDAQQRRRCTNVENQYATRRLPLPKSTHLRPKASSGKTYFFHRNSIFM